MSKDHFGTCNWCDIYIISENNILRGPVFWDWQNHLTCKWISSSILWVFFLSFAHIICMSMSHFWACNWCDIYIISENNILRGPVFWDWQNHLTCKWISSSILWVFFLSFAHIICMSMGHFRACNWCDIYNISENNIFEGLIFWEWHTTSHVSEYQYQSYESSFGLLHTSFTCLRATTESVTDLISSLIFQKIIFLRGLIFWELHTTSHVSEYQYQSYESSFFFLHSSFMYLCITMNPGTDVISAWIQKTCVWEVRMESVFIATGHVSEYLHSNANDHCLFRHWCDI
jgi:hypothetical protein